MRRNHIPFCQTSFEAATAAAAAEPIEPANGGESYGVFDENSMNYPVMMDQSASHYHSALTEHPYLMEKAAEIRSDCAEVNSVESEDGQHRTESFQDEVDENAVLEGGVPTVTSDYHILSPARKLLNEIRATGVIPVVPRPMPPPDPSIPESQAATVQNPELLNRPFHNYPLICLSEDEAHAPPVRTMTAPSRMSMTRLKDSMDLEEKAVEREDLPHTLLFGKRTTPLRSTAIPALGLGQRRRLTAACANEELEERALHPTKLRFGEHIEPCFGQESVVKEAPTGTYQEIPSLLAQTESQKGFMGALGLGLGMKRSTRGADDDDDGAERMGGMHHNKRIVREGDIDVPSPSHVPIFYEEGYQEPVGRCLRGPKH